MIPDTYVVALFMHHACITSIFDHERSHGRRVGKSVILFRVNNADDFPFIFINADNFDECKLLPFK